MNNFKVGQRVEHTLTKEKGSIQSVDGRHCIVSFNGLTRLVLFYNLKLLK